MGMQIVIIIMTLTMMMMMIITWRGQPPSYSHNFVQFGCTLHPSGQALNFWYSNIFKLFHEFVKLLFLSFLTTLIHQVCHFANICFSLAQLSHGVQMLLIVSIVCLKKTIDNLSGLIDMI